jgi:hypothetical protein
MKHLFLSLCFLAGSLTVHAQSADLSIQFFNYTNGQVFSTDTIKTRFIIRNNSSSVTLNIGDTLYVNARINGTLQALDLFSANASPIVLTKVLNNGDTLSVNPGVILGSLTLPFFPGSTTLEVCMIVWGKGKSSVGPTYGGDPNTANNVACVTYDPTFTSTRTVSNKTDELQVFPNPANNEIGFYSLEDVALNELRFSDLNGRKLDMPIRTVGKSQSVDVSTLANGVYFYKALTTKGSLHTGKFMVNH